MKYPSLVTLPLKQSTFVYHPMMRLCSKDNVSWCRDFVKISANWFADNTFNILIVLFVTYSRNWYYLALMCLVYDIYLWLLEMSIVHWLSSKTLHITVILCLGIALILDCISFSSSIIGMASLIADDSPMYSASHVDSAISVCNYDFHISRYSAYDIM